MRLLLVSLVKPASSPGQAPVVPFTKNASWKVPSWGYNEDCMEPYSLIEILPDAEAGFGLTGSNQG